MSESDEERVRGEIVAQLRESLSRSREMMLNEKLDQKAREQWTQANTNTAHVLNQVLRDVQFKDWEKRLKELEQRKRRLQGAINRLEKDTTVQTGEATQDSEGPQEAQGES